jgi:RHS repeat-associated protein
MLQPERQFSSGKYRYGFNAKENDNEVKGIGNQQDYGMRVYDPRLGRFLSVDPLFKDFAFYTPYQFSGNKPIWKIDLDGLEEADPPKNDGKSQIKVVSKSELNFTAGFQFSFGGTKDSRGFGLDFSPASFNILKIEISETIDARTGETKSDYNFNWFTGDVENSVKVKTPVGSFGASNTFKVNSEMDRLPGTQKTAYSYATPSLNVNGVLVSTQYTCTETCTGETSTKVGAKTSASFKFIFGVEYSTSGSVEATETK